MGFSTKAGAATASGDAVPEPVLDVCQTISCDLTSLTNKPAVTTILMALGDESDSQLVVNGASAQLVAESIIRYTSPKTKPRILLIHDYNSQSESPTDFAYTASLLERFEVVRLNEPADGVRAKDLEGFDVIWLSNPGHPMNSSKTRDALIAFTGGVVLQGDDMSIGQNFDNSALTGLKTIDNGTSVTCGGKSYNHDDNAGEKYRVSLNQDKIPGVDSSTIEFRYGNDIDKTTPIRKDLEVLATAKGGPASCVEDRPAIVRYTKAAL